MGYGTEIYLGFTRDQFPAVEKALNLVIDTNLPDRPLALTILEGARKAALETIGLVFHKLGESRWYGQAAVYLDGGKEITFHALRLGLHFEEGEQPTNSSVVFGIVLEGWYGPHLLYPSDEEPIHMTERELKIINVFRDKLAETYPIFSDAKVLIKTAHY